MGRVIGKQGATIKEIRERTGCRVDAEDRDGDMCEFRFSGLPDRVAMARKMILDIVNDVARLGDGGRSTTGNEAGSTDDGANETIEFHEQAAGAIIGARGATIMDLRQQSGARIKVEKVDGRCRVTLGGPPGAVERARSLVTEVVQQSKEGGDGGRAEERRDQELGEGAVTESMDFPPAFTGGIIGTRGAKIADVRQRSGAKVQVEKVDDRCRVTVSGTSEQVSKARTLITALASESAAASATAASPSAMLPVAANRGTCEEVMDVPLSQIGRVIGKGGETMQQLQRETGAQIAINARDKPDPCPVRISGTFQQVEVARRRILEIVDGTGRGQRRTSGAGGGDVEGGFWGCAGSGAADPMAMWWGGGPHGGAPPMGPPPTMPGVPPGMMGQPPMPGFWPGAVPPGAGGPCAPWDVPAGDGNANRGIDLDEL